MAPLKANHPCNHPGCPKVTRTGPYCDDHLRPHSADRGYDRRWRKARARHLARHPLCVQCEAIGRVEAATELDHIIPHRGDKTLFWDQQNWQGLCGKHHDEKSRKGL